VRILLIGPTAVGKTSLSITLAQEMDAEIISADSRQCYKYMDIGTSSPTAHELKAVKHYNISILDPHEKDSAADFYERAMQWEEEIRARDKQILYVGGSTLHLQVIIQPMDDVPASSEENQRILSERAEQEGIETLYRELEEVDPEYAEQMDGMNPQRIIRALDVWMQTGKPFSSFHSRGREVRPESGTVVFGLKRDRRNLYDRINRRVDKMMEAGFLDEVKNLLASGYSLEDRALQTVGYREAINYIDGKISREKMMRDMKTQTRRYAKRQLTWFRRWEFIRWLDMDEYSEEEAVEFIKSNIKAIRKR